MRWESVLIALLGTILGTGLGLGLGSASIRSSTGELHQLAVPGAELAVITALAAVLAAALPARRAARLDVLHAISSGDRTDPRCEEGARRSMRRAPPERR